MARESRDSAGVPLFSRAELVAAFSLVLSSDRAARLANRWFEMFGEEDRLDGAGRFLYRDQGVPSNAILVIPSSTEEDARAEGMYDWLLTISPDQLEERLLGFSDVHLDLLAVTSSELRKRIDSVRDDPNAARRYATLKDAIKRRQR